MSLNRPELEHKRRRRDLFIIMAIVPAVALLIYLESNVTALGGALPVPTNIFILGLINVNVILLILLVFLVLRNTAKLFFERRGRVIGARLRSKLIAAFVAFTIIPTFLLFFLVIGFINKSIDGWFSINIEDSLKESLELGQNYYRDTAERVMSGARTIAFTAARSRMDPSGAALNDLVEIKMKENDYSTIEVYAPNGSRTLYHISSAVNLDMVPDVDPATVAAALGGQANSFVETMKSGDVVRAVSPIVSAESPGAPIGAVAVSYYVPKSLVEKMKEISAAFEGYKQLKLLKNPVKASYFTIILIITLLIVFFSIWIGRYIAKEITVPIHELVEGTEAVASGNLDVRVDVKSNDEISQLVTSFNRMTDDLRAGKARIEEANLDLRNTNLELDRRRRYIEIVLGNIPAGVVSLDRLGGITSINRVAAEMLGVDESRAAGSNYTAVMRPEDSSVFASMISEMSDLGMASLERQMKVPARGTVMTVLVNLNAIKDESGRYLGTVAVLDDLTHLLKTQRMFAWKEVARRIAHEIKNPLTPIKLSAQRLRKKYHDRLDDGDRVFDECTDTIIRQVDDLKTLVNEFSNFARMPASNPSPNDLNEIVHEIVSLYKGGHGNIAFESSVDPSLPVLHVDRDQMKRVLINLVDNAITAVDGDGTITVETHFDPAMQLARIEVSDDGCGLTAEAKQRLFEPYFSTKKTGTGLGLAIVSNIVSDHNGYIRVKDNSPRGTRFIIELPAKTVTV